MPFLSYIVTAHNSSETIYKALSSVVLSDYRDFEVIVVNDASIDETEAIVLNAQKKLYEPLGIELTLLSESFANVGLARQAALLVAKGEYILFCDSDDSVVSSSISSVVKHLKKNRPDILWTNFNRVFHNGESKKCSPALKNVRNINYDLEKGYVVIDDVNQFKVLWNKAYSRKFLLKNNISFKSSITGEDAFFNLKCIGSCPTIDTLNISIYNYSIGVEGSVTHLSPTNDSFRQQQHWLDALKNVFGTASSFKINSFYSQELILMLYTLSRHSVLTNNSIKYNLKMVLKTKSTNFRYLAKKWISVFLMICKFKFSKNNNHDLDES